MKSIAPILLVTVILCVLGASPPSFSNQSFSLVTYFHSIESNYTSKFPSMLENQVRISLLKQSQVLYI